MNCYFLDFADSFSFNLFFALKRVGLDSHFIASKDHLPLLDQLDPEGGASFILGPGPGHPGEYREVMLKLLPFLKRGSPALGVCLGHQLLLHYLYGFSIQRAARPRHGQRIWVHSPQGAQLVQVYHSLVVQPQRDPPGAWWGPEGELMAYRDEQVMTYQFHPESVATPARDALCCAMRDFFYNRDHEGYRATQEHSTGPTSVAAGRGHSVA